jgi:transcriptional regulator NrdR family protein
VTDSRPSTLLGVMSIRRRRQCKPCGIKFTTYEVDWHVLGPMMLDEKKAVAKLNAIRRMLEEGS